MQEKRPLSFGVQLTLVFFGLVFLFSLNVGLGSVSLSFSEIISNLFRESDASVHTILWQFRLPKALTCILAGAGLATSGLLMQTLFRNPLAGPDVLGLSSGASLAVGLLLLAGKGFLFTSNAWSLAIAASGGGALVLLLMLTIARSVRDNTSLLIIGLMMAAATSSVMSVIQFISRADDLQSYIIWTMGSVGNTGWNEVGVLAVILFVGLVISVFLLKSLNGWLLGENYAHSLGINVPRARIGIVVATGFMTGGITAFCGPIAFVGLAVPHLARLATSTTNHRILLPIVACGGAMLLLLCDTLSQAIGNVQSLPLNALTSLIGAPVVIYQVIKMKRVSV
ncbi:MAG: iron ABC transporter permease [Bacteroidetes bacterium]|nr:iron ABC transporter permease [Bacteroidota bacterium]